MIKCEVLLELTSEENAFLAHGKMLSLAFVFLFTTSLRRLARQPVFHDDVNATIMDVLRRNTVNNKKSFSPIKYITLSLSK